VASEKPPGGWDYSERERSEGWLLRVEHRCPNCKQWHAPEYYEYAHGEEIMTSRRCQNCRER